MSQQSLFDDKIDKIELSVTSTNKGKSRELTVSSDLMRCGLLVYQLATTNGSPDLCVIDPRSPDKVIRVEVTGSHPASSGNGRRPSGNHNSEKYDVLAMVDEKENCITYRPNLFSKFIRVS